MSPQDACGVAPRGGSRSAWERPGADRDHFDERYSVGRVGLKRPSSSALLIMLTEDSAIGAPATTGLSRPKAASGRPATC